MRSGVNVTTPASFSTATGSAIFPVQGPFTFGGDQSRFGVGRPGHIHEGQDIAADEGTPVVAPVAGSVFWIAYQADGRGLLRGRSPASTARHYVFMHLQANSTLVTKGQAIAAGSADRFRGQHRRVHRAAPALRDLAQRLAGLEGLDPDRPAPRPAGVVRSIDAINLTQPSLSSGSLRLPHFGDCTHDGQPDSHGHSLTSR